jgi:AcrR family transcriptional regulator
VTSEPGTLPVAPAAERAAGRRRRPAELRRLLLDTGAQLFAEQGYEATTYRQITTRAGVSDSVLFRHFGSRDQLLVEAVVEPFAEFFTDFSRRWAQLPQAGADQDHPLRRAFVTELFGALRRHREPLRAMLTVLPSPTGDRLMREVGTRLDPVIGGLRDIGEQHDRRRGRSTLGVEVKARLVIGMAVTAAVLEDWFVPAGADRATTDLFTAAMAELALTGHPVAVRVAPAPAAVPVAGPVPGSAGAEPGRRRRSDLVRASIVAAARSLFAEPGYGATTYRTIADAANTSESALFRHFGSKSALVEEAVFEPLVTAYSGCRGRWTIRPGGVEVPGDRTYLLVELYRFFRGQRAQLRLLMGLAHDPAHDALNHQIREWLGDVRRGLTPDPGSRASQAQVSSLMAMALAAATLDDWFLPHRPGELTNPAVETALEMIIHGPARTSGE